MLERRAVGNQVPPKRVAGGMETFHDRPVGLGGDEVGGNLWFFVMAHPHIIGIGNGGGAQPVRGAARPRRVEVADVDRAVFHEVTATRRRVFALPRADWDPATHPHIAQAPLVVLPANRLLKPGDVEVVYPVAELERLRDCIALVGVDGDEEVAAGGRTRFRRAWRLRLE